jgi:hypothetical protein
MKVSNRDVFQGIMRELRSLPEESDRITAFGYHPDDYTDIDVLGDFAEAIWGEEELKSLTDDVVNAFVQLHSIDFETKHEGIDTFYENFYEDNQKEDVLRACAWYRQNGFTEMADRIAGGYDSQEKQQETSDWIAENAAEIYRAYRKLMFTFEERFLSGEEQS